MRRKILAMLMVFSVILGSIIPVSASVYVPPLEMAFVNVENFENGKDIKAEWEVTNTSQEEVTGYFIAGLYEEGTNEDYPHIWLGEPAQFSDRTIIKYQDVLDAVNRDIKDEGNIVIGADIARFGKDRTVFFKRKGLKIIDWKMYPKTSIDEVVSYLIDFVGRNNTHISIRIDDTGIGCFTMNTKILTVNGWKFANEIKKDDIVFSKDEKGNITKEKVINNIKREKTRIININGVEFAWSHLLYYKTRKNNKWMFNNWEEVIKRKEIFLDNREWKWQGRKQEHFILEENSIIMPNGGKKLIRKEQKINMDIFVQFLGWYVSEGCTDLTNNSIRITQKDNTEKSKEIEHIISNMGFKIKKTKNNSCIDFVLYDKVLLDWLRDNCYTKNKEKNCYNKRVPNLVKELDKENIRLFLASFRKGDGHIHKGSGLNHYTTSSILLADDLSELIYKTGNYARKHVKQKKGNKNKIEDRIITATHDIYCVNEWSSNKYVTIKTKEKTEYFDNVYQITITGDTKLLYNNIGGRDFWTHNGGVTDYMMKYGYNVVPINFGQRAQDNENYYNAIAEMWFHFKSIVKTVSIPDIQELKNELVTREFGFDNKERRKVQSKEEYKKKYGKSPDFADALLLCFYNISDANAYFIDGVI